MVKIIVNTTFRDFTGSENDKMQINFIKSLKRQTMQDFMLVVTIFDEVNVENIVQSMLGDQCFFIHDEMQGNYKFSLSKTFMNGVDYGLQNHADVILDCSSDIILQSNFLEIVANNCSAYFAGISHPNIFLNKTSAGKRMFEYGEINKGIDARFFSLDLFRDKHVYSLMKKYPSYDYGAGIEIQLCCIGIKYAKKCYNIFPESKVIKMENDRGVVSGVQNSFMREGYKRNLPTVMLFMQSEGILTGSGLSLVEINLKYKPTKKHFKYRLFFAKEYFNHKLKKQNA